MDYKEKLEEAKRLYTTANADQKYVLESIFPELKESEDEKIRKEIVRFIRMEVEDEIVGNKWIAWLEKQGEKPQGKTAFEAIKEKPVDNANKVEPKFKIKLAGREYNVLEIKESAGVTFYGIEDEPNHIDYVLSDDCEIISGYGEKEKGSPYPTKSAIFSEQNSAWSKDDDAYQSFAISAVEDYYDAKNSIQRGLIDWLKSLKDKVQPQKQWKPSDEQVEALKNATHIKPFENPSDSILWGLYEQLKKLREE